MLRVSSVMSVTLPSCRRAAYGASTGAVPSAAPVALQHRVVKAELLLELSRQSPPVEAVVDAVDEFENGGQEGGRAERGKGRCGGRGIPRRLGRV